MLKTIKDSWGWIGIDPIELIDENEFGNVIFKNSDGTYWRVIPEELDCYQVAYNFEDFEKIRSSKEFIEDWEMMQVVQLAKSSQGLLNESQKYCLVIPGVAGGKYSSENIRIMSFEEVIAVSGDFAKQIKDLPDGSKVKITTS